MKDKLKSQFKMSDLGPVKHYLSIEVHRTKKRISLTQTEYITDMLKCFGMENCAPKPTLMNDKIRLDILDDTGENLAGDPLFETNKECYQQAIGSLLYLLLETRPDISFAIAILSRFTVNSYKKQKTLFSLILAFFLKGFCFESFY